MKRATVYRRRMLYLIHASSRTTDGVWILTEPFLQLPASCEDEELGGAVEAALDGSRTAIAHPESWDGISDPLLRMAGVKSWSTFAKSAVCLEIEETDGRLSIVPARNLGVDGGFEADPSRAVTAQRGARAAIGAAARRLLS